MPLALGGGAKKKDEGDHGFLPDLAGKVADFATSSPLSPIGLAQMATGKDFVNPEDISKQARGVTDFVAHGGLLPAVAGAGLATVRAPLTMTAAALGNDVGEMERSPLSFMYDTENVKKQQALAARGNTGITGAADKINAMLGLIAPVVPQLAGGFAETGLRIGAGVGAAGTGLQGRQLTPNEAAEMIGVKSYGQAGAEGQGGAMLLGDILNVAPALKGATGGGALNPLADTAAAQKVATAGAALERAPLAPATVPYKGLQQLIERAQGVGEGAVFPKLADVAAGEGRLAPAAAAVAPKLEGALKLAGKFKTAKETRAAAITEQTYLNREIKPKLEKFDYEIKQAVDAGDSALADNLGVAKEEVINAAKREGTNLAAAKMTARGEELAKKYGGETVTVDAYGRLVDEQGGFIRPAKMEDQLHGLPAPPKGPGGIKGAPTLEDYVSPSGRRLSEMQEGAFPTMPEAGAPVLPETPLGPLGERIGSLFPEGGPAPLGATEGISESALGRMGEGAEFAPQQSIQGLERSAEELANAIKGGEKISQKAPFQDVIRQVPASFTEESMAGYLKGLDTPVMPKGIPSSLLKGYDTIMKAWKDTVLPVRPAWHTTNATGNALQAMALGEVEPMYAVRNMRRISDELKNGTFDKRLAPVLGRGISRTNLDAMVSGGEVGKIRSAGRKLVEKSYEKAESVDDFGHALVASNRFEKNLAAGMSEAAAADEAVQFGLKTMGDFGNMNSFERSTLRRVIPFYPWYKHTAQATIRFPMENPGRFLQSQAWANRLNPQAGQTPEGGEFLKNAIPMGGGRFLRLGGDIGLGFENNPILDPTALGGGLSPALQAIPAMGGLNIGRGRELRTDPNQGRLSQIGGYLTNMTPLTKLAAEGVDYARGEGNLSRDDTRGLVISGKRPVADTAEGIPGIPAPLLPFLTGSSITKPDLSELAKRSKTKEKTEKKAAKTYEKSIKKSPKGG